MRHTQLSPKYTHITLLQGISTEDCHNKHKCLSCVLNRLKEMHVLFCSSKYIPLHFGLNTLLKGFVLLFAFEALPFQLLCFLFQTCSLALVFPILKETEAIFEHTRITKKTLLFSHCSQTAISKNSQDFTEVCRNLFHEVYQM